MLKRFNVKNFLSFSCREDGKSQEFSMIPGKVQRKREHIFDDGTNKLLKFAAVYGANASGKSNLVKAVKAMQEIVTTGSLKGYTEKYCRMDVANKEKASYFEVEIILDGKCYSYGFEAILNKSRFVSEWLVELHPSGREIVIFERDLEAKMEDEKCKFYDWKNIDLNKKMKVYAWEFASDISSLLLFKMNDTNKSRLYKEYEEIRIFREIFWWFKDSLNIIFPDTVPSGYEYNYLLKHASSSQICDLISSFGTGITGISHSYLSLEKFCETLSLEELRKLSERTNEATISLANGYLRTGAIYSLKGEEGLYVVSINKSGGISINLYKFMHGENGVFFQINEESDGTIRLLDLLEVLLSDGNRTFVIDELDRCLHPNLTYHFVETFLRYAEKKNIQLIVTTHESRLLDLDLLRRDEVWFANKRDTGESDLYSLEEFNERYDKKIDKAYLEGRYRGVPVFDSIFPVCGEESS